MTGGMLGVGVSLGGVEGDELVDEGRTYGRAAAHRWRSEDGELEPQRVHDEGRVKRDLARHRLS